MERFLHAINSVPGCEWKLLNKLWLAFMNWRYVWERATLGELINSGTSEQFALQLCELRRKFDIEREFAKLWDHDLAAMGRLNAEYPGALLQLPDAPFLLYRKGVALNAPARMIAIVGTRNPTRYGEKIAHELAGALALQNVTVVSGLAFGIDAAAHFATVGMQKPTIAVLASGLYEVTPSTHQRLAQEILRCGGSLVSEYPPNDPAYPVRFLQRNRIIAGLCDATVVVEAGKRSGALATARCANEYNRDVYAVPGDITKPQAQGCLKLIYDGAHPLISVEAFLEDCKLTGQKKSFSLTIEEQALVNAFEHKACSTDELMEKTLLPIQDLNVLLYELQFKAVVRRNNDFLWELNM
jgi:DNA processing protein